MSKAYRGIQTVQVGDKVERIKGAHMDMAVGDVGTVLYVQRNSAGRVTGINLREYGNKGRTGVPDFSPEYLRVVVGTPKPELYAGCKARVVAWPKGAPKRSEFIGQVVIIHNVGPLFVSGRSLDDARGFVKFPKECFELLEEPDALTDVQVLQAIRDGVSLQCRARKDAEWYDVVDPRMISINSLLTREYRIKPKPKTMVINGEEVPQPVKGGMWFIYEAYRRGQSCIKQGYGQDHNIQYYDTKEDAEKVLAAIQKPFKELGLL